MRKSDLPFALALLLAVVLATLLPGDAPWINDEPMLLYRALAANQHGQFPLLGLVGSLGVPYGPVPLWIYKAALGVTHSLIAIVCLKAFVMQAVVALALAGISVRLELPRWPILLALLSPLAYFYSRILWDNVFAIPFSAILFFAYVSFCKKRAFGSFLVLLLMGVLLLHTHLMSVIVLVPLFVVFAIYERDWWLARWKLVLPVTSLFAIASLPYLYVVLTTPKPKIPLSPMIAFSAMFTGIRFYNFIDFFNYFTPELPATAFPGIPWIVPALVAVTGLVCWFFVVGLVTSVRTLSLKAPSARDKLTLIGLGTFAMTFFVFLRMKGWAHPHYYNASWFIYFYFLWRYFDRPAGVGAFFARTLYAGSLVTLLGVFIYYVHVNGGDRGGHYGATLGNQLAILEQLEKSPGVESVGNLSVHYQAFPHAFWALQQIEAGRQVARLNDANARWVIDYDRHRPLYAGWLELYPKE